MDRQHAEEAITVSGGRLDLRVEVGEVVIQTHDEPRVVVDVVSRHMDVDVAGDGQTVWVTVEQDEAARRWHRRVSRLQAMDSPRAEVTVTIPRRCAVHARVVAGSLRVQQVEAPVITRVTAGNTDLHHLNGAVDATAVSGQIIYHGALADEQHRFKTTAGRLELQLNRIPNARLDIETVTGQVNCDFPVSQQQLHRRLTGAHLVGTLGTGTGQIRGRVVTGTLKLKAV